MGAGLGGKARLCQGTQKRGLETRAPTPGYEALGVPLLQVVGGGWRVVPTLSLLARATQMARRLTQSQGCRGARSPSLHLPALSVCPLGAGRPPQQPVSPPRRGCSLVGGGGDWWMSSRWVSERSQRLSACPPAQMRGFWQTFRERGSAPSGGASGACLVVSPGPHPPVFHARDRD